MSNGMESFLISEELKKVNSSLGVMTDKMDKIEASLLDGGDEKPETIVDLLKVVCYYFREIKSLMDSVMNNGDADTDMPEEESEEVHEVTD